jgi:hypothetical protein
MLPEFPLSSYPALFSKLLLQCKRERQTAGDRHRRGSTEFAEVRRRSQSPGPICEEGKCVRFA